MAVIGKVLIDSGYAIVLIVVNDQRLVQSATRGEIFCCHLFAYGYRVGFLKCSFSIAFPEGESKHREYGAIAPYYIFTEAFAAAGPCYEARPPGPQPYRRLNFRIVLPEQFGKGCASQSKLMIDRPHFNFRIDTKDPICVFMKAVVAEFVQHEQHNDEA